MAAKFSSKVLKYPLAYSALLFAHLIWGSNFVIAKLALTEIPTMSLGFLRFTIAFILILPFLWPIRNKLKIKSEHLLSFVAIGLSITTFHIFLFYEGLKRTSSIDASVLALTVPIISVIASWFILREKIFLINLVGVVFGFIGALIVLGLPLLLIGNLTSEVLLGNSLIIISSVFFVFGAVISKKMLEIYSPLLITASAFLIGSVTFLLPAVNEYFVNPNWIFQVTFIGWLGLLFIIMLSTISAYFLFEWGVKKVGVVQADLVQYIQPAIAATLAVPILNERISFSFIIGTCLIVLGVYLGTLGRSEHHYHHLKHHRV